MTTATAVETPTDEIEITPPSRKVRAGTGARSGEAGWTARIALLVLCLLWLIPTIGLLVSSFREETLIKTTGWWTVFSSPLDFSQWTFENYGDVLFDSGMGDAFVNSLIISIPATVIPVLFAAFAAYAFAWMEFPARNILFVVVIGLLVIPLQVAFIPLLELYGDIGLSGEFAGVWLAHAAFGMPLAVYILRNYMGTLPREVIESARVDGAGHFAIFWRLVFPLSIPALAAYTIFQFLWVWNDLLVALIFLGPGDMAPTTVALSSLIGSRGQDWQLLTAGAFITMLLPMIVFFGLQRFFVRGLTAGSVKG
ncbi:MAG: carbohydrate ABC transporter permease [Acidimicrobiales bacterium]